MSDDEILAGLMRRVLTNDEVFVQWRDEGDLCIDGWISIGTAEFEAVRRVMESSTSNQ